MSMPLDFPKSTLLRQTALAAAMLASTGCNTFEFLTDNCETEFVRVTWPATITRGSSTTSVTLTGSVSPGNIDPAQFTQLRQTLVTGGGDLTNVVWTVPAFETNGGYVAFMHAAPLTTGQTEPVNLAWDGGGWGTVASARPFAPTVAVRADNFTATSASGTMTVLSGTPLRLRLDVTTHNAAGETIRLTGDAQFEYQKVRSSCS